MCATDMTDVPRRIDVTRQTEAELVIRKVVKLVESMGADERLTDAVVKLDEARNAVADYVDGVPRAAPEPTAEPLCRLCHKPEREHRPGYSESGHGFVEPTAEPEGLFVTTEEAQLVREQAEVLIGSYEIRGAPDRKQPTEWHEGKALEALADRMERHPNMVEPEGDASPTDAIEACIVYVGEHHDASTAMGALAELRALQATRATRPPSEAPTDPFATLDTDRLEELAP